MINWGPGISALIGAGATLLAGLLVYWKRRRDTRKNLRIALEQEIKGMQGSLRSYSKAIDSNKIQYDIIPETNFVNTVVYQNNTQHLGLLTDPEVDAITEFYTEAIQLGKVLEMLGEHEKPAETASYHAWFRENGLNDLLGLNEDALQQLRKHLQEAGMNESGSN